MSKFFILPSAFLAGASVMMLELSASRLLAPYFGNSIFVWTNIIGLVLAFLAVGYFLGGRLADRERQDDGMILGLLFALSGLVSALVPWLVKFLGGFVFFGNSLFLGKVFSIFTLSGLVFALPVGLLGAVSPVLVKLLAQSGVSSGRSAGLVGAWGTAGSIVGTFLSGLVLIPFIGTRLTVLSVSCVLVVLSLFFLRFKKPLVVLVGLLFLSLSSSYFYLGAFKESSFVVYEGESPYHFIQIQDNGKTKQMIFDAGLGVQTIYDPTGRPVGYGYYDLLAKLPEVFLDGGQKDSKTMESGQVKILMIGLAGGEIFHQMQNKFEGKLSLTAVEIDPKVVELAYRFFDLGKLPLRVVTEDARFFLQNTSEKYDIIIVDAYQNELFVPWQLSTYEFWQTLESRLSDRGFMASNLLAGLPTSPLLSGFANTLAKTFPQVLVGSSSTANYYLLAGKAVGNLDRVFGLPGFTDAQAVFFDPKLPVLTDDKAPVEKLAKRALLEYFR